MADFRPPPGKWRNDEKISLFFKVVIVADFLTLPVIIRKYTQKQEGFRKCAVLCPQPEAVLPSADGPVLLARRQLRQRATETAGRPVWDAGGNGPVRAAGEWDLPEPSLLSGQGRHKVTGCQQGDDEQGLARVGYKQTDEARHDEKLAETGSPQPEGKSHSQDHTEDVQHVSRPLVVDYSQMGGCICHGLCKASRWYLRHGLQPLSGIATALLKAEGQLAAGESPGPVAWQPGAAGSAPVWALPSVRMSWQGRSPFHSIHQHGGGLAETVDGACGTAAEESGISKAFDGHANEIAFFILPEQQAFHPFQDALDKIAALEQNRLGALVGADLDIEEKYDEGRILLQDGDIGRSVPGFKKDVSIVIDPGSVALVQKDLLKLRGRHGTFLLLLKGYRRQERNAPWRQHAVGRSER